MDSNLQHQLQPRQHQFGSGLTRYRSAPSSYFDSFSIGGASGGDGCAGGDVDQFLNARSVSPETYRIFNRFMSSGGADGSNTQNLCDFGQNSRSNQSFQSQFIPSMKQEPSALPSTPHLQQQHQEQEQEQQQNTGYSSDLQMMYQNQSQATLNPVDSNLGGDNSYKAVSSMAMDRPPPRMTSNLVRGSSSPAGLFSVIDVGAGYAVMKAMGNYGGGNSTNAEAPFSSASRLKDQMDFSSGQQPSSSGLMAAGISEIGDGNVGDEEIDANYLSGFPIRSWEDSTFLSDKFMQGVVDNDRRSMVSSSNVQENQSSTVGNRVATVLSHHLSLPKSSAELEKLLQHPDSVPCRIRAKRGCATHPRSIAERVRRTKISERTRKLQDLVPNMDKQTNTVDMLDLAVDYIKDLQKQVKTLSDNRLKCTCSAKVKP